MKKPGNETPVGSWAFSQRWIETKKSCRCCLSYESAACNTADQEVLLDQPHLLASTERTALSWLNSFLSSRS